MEKKSMAQEYVADLRKTRDRLFSELRATAKDLAGQHDRPAFLEACSAFQSLQATMQMIERAIAAEEKMECERSREEAAKREREEAHPEDTSGTDHEC
jgi:hypothetical protein